MKIIIRSECISPHLNPFVSALNKLAKGIKFIYTTTDQGEDRRCVGWHQDVDFEAVQDDEATYAESKSADVLIDMLRDVDLLSERLKNGLKTFYCGERWFKPPAGILRLLSPKYFRMACRFTRLFQMKPFSVLAMGVHSARDFLRLVLLFHGDLRMIFKSPEIAFESRPGGSVLPLKTILDAKILTSEELSFAKKNGYVQVPQKYWGVFKTDGIYSKIKIWGYFVEEGKKMTPVSEPIPLASRVRVLWAGRMLRWKRTMDLVRVARRMDTLSVDIYGQGPCRKRLVRCMSDRVKIHGYISNTDLRQEMHRHDVYVLPSDASEGWGAVVSEALSEHVRILATAESGAGATLLPIQNLYNAGDISALCQKLSKPVDVIDLGLWTGESAAHAFLNMIGG